MNLLSFPVDCRFGVEGSKSHFMKIEILVSTSSEFEALSDELNLISQS